MSKLFKYLILLTLLTSCKPKGKDCLGVRNVYGQYIVVQNLPLTLNVHPSVPDDFYKKTEEAVKEINSIANKPLLFLTRYSGEHKNNIYLADDWSKRDTSEMGVTFWRDDTRYIYQVQIFINGANYNFRQDKHSFDALIKHELLHSIGLTHSKIRGNLMYPSTPSESNPKIGEEEIKNVRCLYE